MALAVSEPGENWDGESIDGREFELPSTWIKAPPRKGLLEVHYRTDHTSEETIKSKLRRGDNFALRLSWLHRTLIWEESFKVIDVGFQGNDREAWYSQRSWTITKPLRLKQASDFYHSALLIFKYGSCFSLKFPMQVVSVLMNSKPAVDNSIDSFGEDGEPLLSAENQDLGKEKC